MKLNYIGYDYLHEPDFFISRPEGRKDSVFLLLRTPAIFNINGKDIKASKNSFILFREGTPQFYRADNGKFANDWFHFSISEDEYNIFEALSIPFNTLKYLGDTEIFSDMILKMCYEFFSDNMYRSYTLGLCLKLFFTKLGEYLQSSNEVRNSLHYEHMNRLRSMIYNNPSHNWKVEELAAEAAMSESYFSHMYKNFFGISIINEVINSKVDYAKLMLSTTDLPVTRIGEMCGYRNNAHFTKQFKSRTGMTPSQCRKSMEKSQTL